NIFGAEGSLSQAALTFIGTPTSTFINTSFASVQGLVNGDFGVSSPFASKPIGVAVGGEYRRYSGAQFGDLPSATPGAILGAGGAFSPISGSYFSREGFAELNIPLIADRPFFHDLTLETGARYASYSNSGGNWTYKFGGSWAPIEDIRVRGVWSRAVRAPNIGELFAPVATGLNNLATDPCQLALPTGNATTTAICSAQLAAVGLPASRVGAIPAPIAGQINVTTGGNPNLSPEVATTYTVGIVVQPRSVAFLRGLTATADFYDVVVTGAISSPTVGDIVNGCFGQSNPNDIRCQAIRRNPLTGGLSGDPSTTQGAILQSSNLGFLNTRGINFGADYSRSFGEIKANIGITGNYTLRSRFQSTPSSFVRECVNFYSVSCDPVLPKFTFNQRTSVSVDLFDVSLLWRHISPTRYEPRTGATATTPPVAGTVGSFGSTNPATIIGAYRQIPAFDYLDLTIGANVTSQFTLGFLVTNLLNRQAPDVGNTIGSTGFNSGNTFPSTYDAIGRRFTINGRLKF
ncbi:MAG: TonB-dependent receptor domain-containing protein, partial [Sphingomonas sp.]